MAGNNNIYIGNAGRMEPEEGKIRIGTFGLHTETHIAGIRSAAVSGSPVVIGMDGKLGVTMSSAKFKEAIKPMDKASETILALKPVTFCYKGARSGQIPQFGLVAEEVEKVDPDLVFATKRESHDRPLRGGERDVAQRVPERAPEGRRARSDYRSDAETNGSSHCDYPKSERPTRTQQTGSEVSRQSLATEAYLRTYPAIKLGKATRARKSCAGMIGSIACFPRENEDVCQHSPPSRFSSAALSPIARRHSMLREKRKSLSHPKSSAGCPKWLMQPLLRISSTCCPTTSIATAGAGLLMRAQRRRQTLYRPI